MGDSTPPEIAEAIIEYCSAVSKFSIIFFFSLEVGPFICAIVADWRFLSFFVLPINVVEILLPMDLIRPLLPKRLEICHMVLRTWFFDEAFGEICSLENLQLNVGLKIRLRL